MSGLGLRWSEGFQSAPLTGARGDPVVTFRETPPDGCFNPLPSPEQGEIQPNLARPAGPACFNPLPSPEQGEIRVAQSHGRYVTCFNPLPSPEQGEMLVVVTSQQSESYTGICANRSNGCPSYLIQLSTNGATSCDADVCERREATGTSPSLWVRTSYKTSGPVKSTGSLTP